MDIKRAKQEIIDAIAAYLEKDEYGEYRIPEIRQRPVLLMGAPGIGKTQIMEQIASECDIALVSYTITHHTRQSAVGLPYITDRVYGGQECKVTDYTMSEILASVYDRMEESGRKEGILFIDEINCVSETLAPTMLQFLQCKTFGNRKVPEGWIIVAAGNPPEYNRSVRDFDVVTLDRVRMINVEPDFEVWKEYAYQVSVHPAVISYLDAHRESFFRCETTVDGKRFVTARGWEDLSELVYADERLGKKMDAQVAGQYLQYPGIAQDFANYLELYYRYRRDYGVSRILEGDIPEGVLNRLRYAPFDERLQLVSLLLARLSSEFAAARDRDREISRTFDFLRQLRSELENETADGGAISAREIYDEQLSLLRKSVDERGKAGQNEKQLRASYRGVFRLLDEWKMLLRTQTGDVWEILKGAFAKERGEMEEGEEKVSALLEYAFDFMEAAFGESQEMVVFITELSANANAMWFLGEHESPRYFRYNKALMFEESGADVKRRLDEIRTQMTGAQRTGGSS